MQNDLFDVGADLCTPLGRVLRVPAAAGRGAWVDELEADCDRFNDRLETLRSFILPGGTPGARVPARGPHGRRGGPSAPPGRRCEAYGTGEDGGVNPLTAKYLNRLSDLLFILARSPTSDAAATCCGSRAAAASSSPALRPGTDRRTRVPRRR